MHKVGMIIILIQTDILTVLLNPNVTIYIILKQFFYFHKNQKSQKYKLQKTAFI